MSPRVALQLLSQPVRRSLADHLRPATRTTSPVWTSSARAASRLGQASSICFRCSIQAQSRRQSTTSGSFPPEEPPKPPKPSPETEQSAPSTSTSGSSSPSPTPSTDPASESSTPAATDPSDHWLPSTVESRRNKLQARFSTAMDTLQSRLLTATQTLNDLTGYSSIDKIRLANDRLERQLADAQSRLRDARASYKSLVSHRAATQREVNTLLARKDAWSPPDVERFTALYRSEHELESRVADATRELTEAEAEELRVGTALTTGILRRYHEEQVWSDRIRRASTWGTWGLMGVNVLLFIGLQVFAEPWKRKKLVERFSEAERGLWEEVRREVGEVRGLLMEARANSAGAVEEEEEKEAVLSVTGGETAEELPSAAETVAVNTTEMPPVEVEALRDWEWWQAVILDPHRWQGVVEDLYSERRIDLRMRDATVLALEGALAGAAVAAGVVFMLLKRS